MGVKLKNNISLTKMLEIKIKNSNYKIRKNNTTVGINKTKQGVGENMNRYTSKYLEEVGIKGKVDHRYY